MLLEKEFERPQRLGMWFVMNNIDLHYIEWGLNVFLTIRMLGLHRTD